MSVDSPSRWPDDLVGTLKEFDRRLRALESANRLTSASIGSGGLTVLDGGDVLVDGGSFRMVSNGVEAQLAVVTPRNSGNRQDGWGLTTTDTILASASMSVPTWATGGWLMATANVTAENNSGARDSMWVRCTWTNGISVFTTPTHQQNVDDTRDGSASASITGIQDVRDVSSLEFRAVARSAVNNWGAAGGNVAHVTALALFTGYVV